MFLFSKRKQQLTPPHWRGVLFSLPLHILLVRIPFSIKATSVQVKWEFEKKLFYEHWSTSVSWWANKEVVNWGEEKHLLYSSIQSRSALEMDPTHYSSTWSSKKMQTKRKDEETAEGQEKMSFFTHYKLVTVFRLFSSHFSLRRSDHHWVRV